MNNSDKYFSSRFKFNQDRTKVWKAICEFFQAHVSLHGTVLDLGSGYCDFINNIRAAKKIGMDHSSESASFANPDVLFINQSALEIWPLKDESIDTVFASNFLEHFTDIELDFILGNVHRVLKVGGKLLLIQPNYYYAYKEYWDDYTHKKAFSHTALSDFLISKGFKIRLVEKRALPFSMKSLLPKSYWLTKLYLYSPFKPFAKQMFVVVEK